MVTSRDTMTLQFDVMNKQAISGKNNTNMLHLLNIGHRENSQSVSEPHNES